MGKTLTTRYQITVTVPGRHYSPASWNCKRHGRPNTANIRKFVKSFEASTRPGGCNAHLGTEVVARAEIRLNDGSGKIVTSYEAPGVHRDYMFEVISEYYI